MNDLYALMLEAQRQANMPSAGPHMMRASASVINQLRGNEPMEDTMKWLNENATPLEGGWWEIAQKEKP